MPLPTPEQLLDNEDSLLLKEVRRLMKRVEQLEGRANAQTNFTNAAGAHVVVGTGDLFNTANPFTGTAILFPPYVHTSGNYHIFGMSAGVLQWGASADNGKIYFGGGDGWLDEFGLTFANQEGFVQFLDTADGGTMTIYGGGGNYIHIANSFGGAGIAFQIDDISHVVKNIEFDGTGSIIVYDGNIDLSVGQYLIAGQPPGDTYTPTLTNTTNIDASAVVAPFTYMRVGNFVSVAGNITIDPTAAANTAIGIDIPIASNFTTGQDGNGCGTAQATNTVGSIAADATNDRMTMTFQATSTANTSWRVMFMFEIK